MSERPTRAPVPLIVQQDGGLLGLHPEGAAALRGPAGDRRPVLCLAVAGLYRTGKSYLLNLLKVRSPTLGVFGRVARFARVRPCHRRRRRRHSSTPCFFPHALNRFRGHLLWRPFVPSACSRRPSSVFGSFFLFLIP